VIASLPHVEVRSWWQISHTYKTYKHLRFVWRVGKFSSKGINSAYFNRCTGLDGQLLLGFMCCNTHLSVLVPKHHGTFAPIQARVEQGEKIV
jgi:hypothetical protein